MIDVRHLTATLQALVSQARDWQDPNPSKDVIDAELLIAAQLAPLHMTESPTYLVPLTQEEISVIAGFIAPTTSEIDTHAIVGNFWDGLRDKFPERAFWETAEELGEDFYLGESYGG